MSLPNHNGTADVLESIAAILGVVLAIISAFQHGANPFAGEIGKAALASLAAAFGLHHAQTGK